jgi:O-antigen ligase
MGRDSTLTGRTSLWADVWRMRVDPLFGAGFESFWLGDRARWFWDKYWWQPNQSHNGYIEVFINLGIVGLILLGCIMAWGYRNIAHAYRRNPASEAALRLAYFVAVALYNVTEAGFKTMHPAWIVLLLAIAVPSPAAVEER